MEQVKNYLIYFVSVIVLFAFLFFNVRLFEKKEHILELKAYEKLREYENVSINNDKVSISYPKFNYKVIDEKISSLINKYKTHENVVIEYSISLSQSLVSMFYVIKDDGVLSYENINYSIEKSKFVGNDYLIDFNVLGNEILEVIKHKYSTYIYEKVVEDNFKNTFVKINESGMYVYFSPSIFENVENSVYVFFSSEDSTVANEIKYNQVIAFTFDDGPSKYTKDIVEALILNDAKATFFELGNRMKYNQDIVREIYNRGMEVASHTYAHKNLNKLSEEAIDEEVNSTNILFNEITGGQIPYVRPPYGNANDNVKSRISVPLINWNVDTNDWLYRDSEAVYNHILENAEDGDIILMHDIYPETLEAVKKVLPVLRERGFKVTTVSELASEKGVTLEAGKLYRGIK